MGRPMRYHGSEPFDLEQLGPEHEGDVEPGAVVELPPAIAAALRTEPALWRPVPRSELEEES